MKVEIMDSSTNREKRVIRIEFDRDLEEDVKERLIAAGFDVEIRKFNW